MSKVRKLRPYRTTPTRWRAGVASFAVLTALLPLGSCGGDRGTALSTPVPTSITVRPSSALLASIGATVTFTAEVLDQDGHSMSGVSVEWSSSDPGVASITAGSGVATAISEGSTRITAAAGAATGTAPLTVAQIVAAVELSPSAAILKPWETLRLTATAYDSGGAVVPDPTVVWRSSAPDAVPVDETGEVVAHLLGTAEVTARIEGVEDSAAIGVSTPSAIWAGPAVPVQTGQETDVAINPTDPLNVVVSHNGGYAYSFNGGRTWSVLRGPGVAGGADTNVRFDREGTLFRQSLRSHGPRDINVDRSEDGGASFEQFRAYDPASGEGNPDQGIMTVDTVGSSPYRGNLYVVFSDYPGDGPGACTGFCLRVVVSNDGGFSWSEPVDISDEPRLAQEHSSYITTGPDGEVYAAWWGVGRRIMFARSLDGGGSWEENVVARQGSWRNEPLALSGDVRGNITIDVDRSDGPYRGSIYISGTDLNGPLGGAADAWMIRSRDGGSTWSVPVVLSDGPRGAFRYYFQPRINVAPDGRIDAVWYDTRNSPVGDINRIMYEVYYAVSLDGGRSFTHHMPISSAPAWKVTSCPDDTPCGQRRLYEYLGLASDRDRAIAAWTDAGDGGGAGDVVAAVVWHGRTER